MEGISIRLGFILTFILSVSFAGENYKNVSDDRISEYDRRVEVLLERKLSKYEIKAIAEEIKALVDGGFK